MSGNGDYRVVLERVRRKKKWRPYKKPLLGAAALLAVVLLLAGVRGFLNGRGERQPGNDAAVNASASNAGETILALSEEELAAAREEAEEESARQAVLDSYENLGIANVSGYLNMRKTPESSGDIIGKLEQYAACSILGQEGEWYQIASGGMEGYVNSQYILTGEEAQKIAGEQVQLMAVVETEKLNIRSEAALDPSNVVGQALEGERYPVLEETGEWIRIQEGYISARYAEVRYALNEAKKLDLKAMALSQYDNLVISKVDNYLNVRKEPSTADSSNIIGKFPGKAAGEILETLDGWYKIKSGAITGYITADPQYVAVGQEARNLALEAASLMAIVKTDMLNVRAEPSTDAKIWTQISKEERYHVVEQMDGWVQIELDTGDSEDGENAGDKAYISTRDNNVEVRYALTEAIRFSPMEEKANRESGLRSKLVNYGLQFVGGRYVWGGTNPNTGADCSGFVQYIYRNVAGISLPRTSREQAKVGTAVSSSEMQPGDLIFYTNSRGTVNHVAMYIGNGQIVHAASRRSGIKISTWNYRKPKTIRRMLS